MSMDLKGFDELVNDLNNLGSIGSKIGRKAVEEGAKVVLDQQKKDAPRSDDGDNGADKLDVVQIKKYSKSGTVVAKIGISSENWEDTKSLYFQHYGYEHYKSGNRVEVHLGWINDSFKNCKDKASEIMMDYASKEMDKILK